MKKLLTILAISTGLSVINGCANINTTKLTVDNKSVKTNNDTSTGTVLIDLSGLAGKSGFNTKAYFNDANITQIKIDITGYDMVTASKTVTWTRNSVTVPMTVRSGKNRIISIIGLDNTGKPIAKIMGNTDVYKNILTPVLINYGTTTMARVLTTILNSAQPQIIDNIDGSRLKTLLYKIMDYDNLGNSFRLLDPINIDVNGIAEKIIAANGEIDTENIDDISNSRSPVKVKIFVKDKNGNPVTNYAMVVANDISCNNPVNNNGYYTVAVDQGSWEISAKLYKSADGTTVIVPANHEEVRKLILHGGKVLYASKTVTIKGTSADDITLNLADLEVIL